MWLDLFGFDLTLCMILEYPPGAAQQEADDYDADDRACRRVCNEPPIKLQDHDKDELATTANRLRRKMKNASTPEMAAT